MESRHLCTKNVRFTDLNVPLSDIEIIVWCRYTRTCQTAWGLVCSVGLSTNCLTSGYYTYLYHIEFFPPNFLKRIRLDHLKRSFHTRISCIKIADLSKLIPANFGNQWKKKKKKKKRKKKKIEGLICATNKFEK
jgi:hypothetical protein